MPVGKSLSVFISALLPVLFMNFAAAQDKIIPPEIKTQLARRYASREIDSIEKLVNQASAKGLPQSYYAARLSEAAAKKIKYAALYAVLEKKTRFLEQGLGIVAELEKQRKAVNRSDCVLLTAELLERGASAAEIYAVSGKLGKDSVVEDVLGRAEIAARLKEAGYRGETHRSITALLLPLEMNESRKLAGFLADFPCAAGDRILKEGIEGSRKAGWFKDRLAEEHRKERVKEVLEDKRPER